MVPSFLVGGQKAEVPTGYGFVNSAGTGSWLADANGFTYTGTITIPTLAVSGVSYLANGTAALPSLAFTNSTTSGFYRAGADIWGFSLAAVPAFTIASTEPTVAAAAAAAGTAVWFKGTNGGASTGATAAGRGSPLHLAAGDGGAAAGSGTGGAGGGLFLNGGDGGTSGSGTAGVGGAVYIEGTAPVPFLKNVSLTSLADSDATMTAADMRSGVVTVAAGATNRTKTTPTAAQLLSVVGGAQVGTMLSLSVCNLKAANTVTIGLGSGVTNPSSANLVVDEGAAVTFGFIFTNVTPSSEAVTIIRLAG